MPSSTSPTRRPHTLQRFLVLSVTIMVVPCCDSGEGPSTCATTLEQLQVPNIDGWCPGTYGAATTLLCSSPGYPYFLGTCSDHPVFVADFLLHGAYCFYDRDSGVLVGASRFTDTPTYCGGRFSCIQAGSLPAMAVCGSFGLAHSCSVEHDAGTSVCDAGGIDP